jgi:hypothetical protein
MAEVSAEAQKLDAGIFESGLLEEEGCRIGAAVIDEDDLPGEAAEILAKTWQKQRDCLCFVEHRDDDRKEQVTPSKDPDLTLLRD